MGTGQLYDLADKSAYAGVLNYLTDGMYAMLVTNSYTPDYAADQYKSVPVAFETSGAGYTANGVLLTSKSLSVIAAGSWSRQWAATTAYLVGQIVRVPTSNGHLYRCIVAGTSAGSQPTFPTVSGQVVTDGTVTWAECGVSAIVFNTTFANPTWTALTLSFRYVVIYDSAPATDATRPLLCCLDMGAQTYTGGDLTIALPTEGLAIKTNR